jgi:hypothetical protein
MAITTLSTLSTATFKGNRGLFEAAGANSLVAALNTIVAKVNEALADMNAGAFDVLEVGSGTGSYYSSSDSWITVDGTHPPTLSRFRIQDINDGSFKTVTCDTGVLVVA